MLYYIIAGIVTVVGITIMIWTLRSHRKRYIDDIYKLERSSERIGALQAYHNTMMILGEECLRDDCPKDTIIRVSDKINEALIKINSERESDE